MEKMAAESEMQEVPNSSDSSIDSFDKAQLEVPSNSPPKQHDRGKYRIRPGEEKKGNY